MHCTRCAALLAPVAVLCWQVASRPGAKVGCRIQAPRSPGPVPGQGRGGFGQGSRRHAHWALRRLPSAPAAVYVMPAAGMRCAHACVVAACFGRESVCIWARLECALLHLGASGRPACTEPGTCACALSFCHSEACALFQLPASARPRGLHGLLSDSRDSRPLHVLHLRKTASSAADGGSWRRDRSVSCGRPETEGGVMLVSNNSLAGLSACTHPA